MTSAVLVFLAILLIWLIPLAIGFRNLRPNSEHALEQCLMALNQTFLLNAFLFVRKKTGKKTGQGRKRDRSNF